MIPQNMMDSSFFQQKYQTQLCKNFDKSILFVWFLDICSLFVHFKYKKTEVEYHHKSLADSVPCIYYSGSRKIFGYANESIK